MLRLYREGLKRERFSTYWNTITRAQDRGPFTALWSLKANHFATWESKFISIYLEHRKPIRVPEYEYQSTSTKTLPRYKPGVLEQKAALIMDLVWLRKKHERFVLWRPRGTLCTEGWTITNLQTDAIDPSQNYSNKKEVRCGKVSRTASRRVRGTAWAKEIPLSYNKWFYLNIFKNCVSLICTE